MLVRWVNVARAWFHSEYSRSRDLSKARSSYLLTLEVLLGLTWSSHASFPTGVSEPKYIQANVREAIGGEFPLYNLGFGRDLNYNFLDSLALENNGFARRIYEDSDATLQLQVTCLAHLQAQGAHYFPGTYSPQLNFCSWPDFPTDLGSTLTSSDTS